MMNIYMEGVRRMNDEYLYERIKNIDQKMLLKLESKAAAPHQFSDDFEARMSRLIQKRNLHHNFKSNKRHDVRRAASFALAFLTLTALAGGIANAATNGAVADWITAVCFGHTDGAASTFYYGGTDRLELSDLPDGTIYTPVEYCGDGIYKLDDGSMIPVERIIFLTGTAVSIGDSIQVYILPEK